VPQLDPFLLLDDFHSDKPADYIKGFPWHPHRGIETITYMLHGRVEHGDSMGNSGVILPGGVQWMTAGSGIIHQEMPGGQNGNKLMWGLQLWANLPAKHKMMDPRYRDITGSQIPETIVENNVKIRVICGEAAGVKGPARDIVIEPEYLDVTVPARSVFKHAVKKGHTVFAYVIDGQGYFDEGRDSYAYAAEGANYFDFKRECLIAAETLVMYHDGDGVIIATEGSHVRFLLISGKPLHEPVAWYGPIVMNTREELKTAFEEYQNGTFIRQA
jgi:quercetin 2,3-dioxygenase